MCDMPCIASVMRHGLYVRHEICNMMRDMPDMPFIALDRQVLRVCDLILEGICVCDLSLEGICATYHACATSLYNPSFINSCKSATAARAATHEEMHRDTSKDVFETSIDASTHPNIKSSRHASHTSRDASHTSRDAYETSRDQEMHLRTIHAHEVILAPARGTRAFGYLHVHTHGSMCGPRMGIGPIMGMVLFGSCGQ